MFCAFASSAVLLTTAIYRLLHDAPIGGVLSHVPRDCTAHSGEKFHEVEISRVYGVEISKT